MKANSEALEELHRSLLELTAILSKTKDSRFVPKDLQENTSSLFESVAKI